MNVGDDAALGAEVRRLFSPERRLDMLNAMSVNTRNQYQGSGLELLTKPNLSENDYSHVLVILWLEYQRVVGRLASAYAEIRRLDEFAPED